MTIFGILTGVVLLALVVALVLLLTGMVRSGSRSAGIAASLPPGRAELTRLTPNQLGHLARAVYERRGFRVISAGENEVGHYDLRVRGEGPGEDLMVRCLPAEPVREHEIHALLERRPHDGWARAVLVTGGTFTDHAQVAAEGRPLELVDGSRLISLLWSEAPQVARELGLTPAQA